MVGRKGICGNTNSDISRSRMKLVQSCQKLDKLAVRAINEERVNTLSFNYRENTLGGRDRDVTKSSSGDDLIGKILRGEVKNGKSIAKIMDR